MSSADAQFDDGMFVERRPDVRIYLNIPGRFSLADRRDMFGERRVFPCRAVNLSTLGIALVSHVTVKEGDRIIAHIDHLGKLKGVVARVIEHGFIMGIIANEQERDKLADKIEWLGKNKDHDATDHRADQRVVPAHPNSRMVLPDGRSEACVVLDLSASGAGISADTLPDIGTVLAIGTVVGRVVRHFDGGFGVHFISRQDEWKVEALVTRD